jgi:DNA-binding XRE family transcriptional regulator
MIYFLQAGKGGPVKIGFTEKKLRERISDIQIGCSEELILLGVVQGDQTQEKHIHQEFAEYALRGEWFSPHEKMLETIVRIASIPEPTIKSNGINMNSSRLRRRRDELGLSQKQIAGQLGVAAMTISRWERGESEPQKRLRPMLAQIVGIPIEEILSALSRQ